MAEARTVAATSVPSDGTVVDVRGVVKSFGTSPIAVLDRFSVTVRRGETVALLGPSGCGKTTLLRIVAGFEVPDAGEVDVDGRTVVSDRLFVPPERRKIGFVFQDYALFPHMDVATNVGFGLAGWSARARRDRVREILDLVGLTVFARRYPGRLSGGQQQRVALARALAPAPDVLLLDEPFSHLDAALRSGTRDEVRRILQVSGATTILVTHDQDEAMTFADRLAVMRAGRLEQLGPPEETYVNPDTAFVAGFLGRTNLLRGEAHGETVDTPLGRLPLSRSATGPVLVSVRPEALRLGPVEGGRGLVVHVVDRAFHGHDVVLRCRPVGGDHHESTWTVRCLPDQPHRVGDHATLTVDGPAVPLERSVHGPTPS